MPPGRSQRTPNWAIDLSLEFLTVPKSSDYFSCSPAYLSMSLACMMFTA